MIGEQIDKYSQIKQCLTDFQKVAEEWLADEIARQSGMHD